MTNTDPNEALGEMIRETRQRLESLRRAGVDRLPRSVRTFAPVTIPTATLSVGRDEVPPEVSTPERSTAELSAPTRPNVSSAPVIATSLFEEPAITGPVVPADQRARMLSELAAEVASCVRCPLLAATRTQTVFGDGSPTARLLFIGEAPGADEDRTGIPFVGRAGMLLNDMITKGMGLQREEVYIANILKSRPPENRNPLPDEIVHCLPFLERQIEIIRPEFICMLGKVAASTLLNTSLPLGRLRGKWQRYRGIATIVTYHPAFLLRNPASKKEAWEDLQMLMNAMGLKVASRKKN